MIGYYNYTVVLTYISVLSGVVGIYHAINERPFFAILFMMLSGFCDMFDGKVARLKERNETEIRFGIQIDSLADLVAFGVLPVAIGYGMGLNSIWFYLVGMIFILNALIRLAYFNSTIAENAIKGCKSDYFIGLPVTSSAFIFPFLYLFRPILKHHFKLAYLLLLLVVGILFVANFRVNKLSKKKALAVLIIGGIIFVLLLIKFIHAKGFL